MARRTWALRKYRWVVHPGCEAVEPLARELRTGRLVAQLLWNRGICTADEGRSFLAPKLSDLHDPTLLPGATQAAERLAAAVAAGERIALYGDYDVDGISGLAILYRCLKMFGVTAEYYIPHRIDEGYGLNAEALAALAAGGAKVVVTVDCGITALDCAEHARKLGLTLIVTDHHRPGPALPRADCIVHPTAAGEYPNPDLCGAGVAFKLAWQLCRQVTGSERVTPELRDFLLDATCLAALGTIADVVKLLGENRVIAAYGLKGLAVSRHPGIRALITASGLVGQKVGEYDVGFQLAPRLNAAGRMGHAREAAELLIRGEDVAAEEIAVALGQQNTQRQQVEREIADQARGMAIEQGLDGPEHHVIVLAREGWHPGVIGIVASRLVGQFHKPAVVISLNGASGQGSARSIDGYDISQAFDACRGHLVSFGGHAMAAGLKIAPEQVPAFVAALGEHARTHLPEELLQPGLLLDAEARLAELALPVVEQVQAMAPFGAGNPSVSLAVRGVRVSGPPRRMGRTGKTLSLLAEQEGVRMRCVGFDMGDLADRLVSGQTVDIAGEPTINRFAGRVNVEMMLHDVAWE